jgi:hypothetical protein
MNEYFRQCNICEDSTQFHSDLDPCEINSSQEWYEAQFCKLHRERLNPEARKGCDSPNTPTKGSESSRND